MYHNCIGGFRSQWAIATYIVCWISAVVKCWMALKWILMVETRQQLWGLQNLSCYAAVMLDALHTYYAVVNISDLSLLPCYATDATSEGLFIY